MDDPSPEVEQRLIAILTASLAGDIVTERSLVKEIVEDRMLLVESFASLENLTYELIRALAKDRNTAWPRAREGLPDPNRLALEIARQIVSHHGRPRPAVGPW